MPRGRTRKVSTSHASPPGRETSRTSGGELRRSRSLTRRSRSLTRSTSNVTSSDLNISRSRSLVRGKSSSRLSSIKSLSAIYPKESKGTMRRSRSMTRTTKSDCNGSETTRKTSNLLSPDKDEAIKTRNESSKTTERNHLRPTSRFHNGTSPPSINVSEHEKKALTIARAPVIDTRKNENSSQTRSRSRSQTRSRSTSRSRSRSQTRSIRNILPPGLKLYKRNLAMAFVGRSKESNLWITNIEISENPEKNFVRPFHSEEEAKESAYANSPPKMIPFEDSPNCFLCDSPFHALRRRAMHCQNCGVCICKKCSVTWDKAMVPSTFITKNTSIVHACKTCDYLGSAFRCALLDGNYKHALKLYMSGNINLRCPFINVNPGIEIMYPIHCAASSGNTELLRWLIDTHKCPYNISTSRLRSPVNKRNQHGHRNSDSGIVSSPTRLLPTSNGRTILDIAVENDHVDVLQYLAKEKKIVSSSYILESEDHELGSTLKETENNENKENENDFEINNSRFEDSLLPSNLNDNDEFLSLSISSKENRTYERSVSTFQTNRRNSNRGLFDDDETHVEPRNFRDLMIFCDAFFSVF